MMNIQSFLLRLWNNRPWRILLISVAIIIVLYILLNIGISLLKASHSRPLDAAIYPGARLLQSNRQDNGDQAIYVTEDPIQKVYSFYADSMPHDTNDPNNTNTCQKIYTDKIQSEDPGHWYGGCVVDNSMLNVSQNLSIMINYEKVKGFTNLQTVILITRKWG